MNDFANLSLDELVEISGHDDEWFNANFTKDANGYYHRVGNTCYDPIST